MLGDFTHDPTESLEVVELPIHFLILPDHSECARARGRLFVALRWPRRGWPRGKVFHVATVARTCAQVPAAHASPPAFSAQVLPPWLSSPSGDGLLLRCPRRVEATGARGAPYYAWSAALDA